MSEEEYVNYHQNVVCPCCGEFNPWYNIAGACIFCGAHGFKTLRAMQTKERRKKVEV